MVGSLKLILDDYPVLRPYLLRDDVRLERTDPGLGGLKLKLDPDSFSEEVKIPFFRQPRCELACLV